MNRIITLKEYMPKSKFYYSWLEKIPEDVKKHILYKFLNYNDMYCLNNCNNFARRIVTKEELYIAKKYQESVINEEKYYFNLNYNGKENDFSLTKFNTNFEFEEIERERLEEIERERLEDIERERLELEKKEEKILQEEEEKILELQKQQEETFFEEDYEYYEYLDRKYMEHIEGVNKI